MYEEDSWETPEHPEQMPSAEKEPELVVPPKDPEKGSRFSKKKPAAEDAVELPRKKGIPKWQYAVLGGMVVVVGGAFVMLQLIHPDAAPAYSAAVVHRGPAGMDHKALPSPAGSVPPKAPMGTSPSMPSMGGTAPSSGFSTLNDLPGSSPSAPAAVASSSPLSVASPASSVAASASPASASDSAASVSETGAASSAVAPSSSAPADTQSPSLGLASGTAAASETATHNPQVVQLLQEIRHTKDQIAHLKQELQAEKQTAAASASASPRVITRTVVRYVHVPMAAPQPQPRPAAQAMPGWSVVGGNGHVAILAGPGGQERSVRVGDTLPSGAVVQRIGLGSVTTSDGVIR